MTPVSTASLLDALRQSRLLEPGQMHELTQTLRGRSPEPRALARQLIDRGWLTPFQANLLLQGRGQELLLGSYILLERLGEGGMGQVYKAKNWKLGRVVALKLIRKERLSSEDTVRRFHREIRAAAQLSHPNIVLAYDADEVNGTHFFAMEHVEGVDLAKLVKQHGPLPVAVACEYVRQAALGLQQAHERGMVHRDIKPHNLLLATQGSVVKILDMGLARLDQATEEGEESSTMTQEGAIMGTPDYIAPEQTLDSHRVDIRADLYSLGCTLYFLLTGSAPFAGGSLGQKIAQHQLHEPVPIEQRRPDVPPSLAAVLRRLMAKRPEDRYQTPAEAATALATVSNNSPPSASAGGDSRTLVANTPSGEASAPETVNHDLDFRPTEEAAQLQQSQSRVRRQGRNRRLLFAALGGAVLCVFVPLALVFCFRTNPPTTRASNAQPAELEKSLTNSLGMRLVLIPSGKFLMGSPASEPMRRENEGPQHAVRISRAFYMAIHEVTQEHYEKIMGENPSTCRGGPTHPVENVSWADAVRFCAKLSARKPESDVSRVYRLPTEAEWEYACRAGSRGAFSFGDDHRKLAQYGWFHENDGGLTHPVGQLEPNAWGLYDMHGNVWEWCADHYASDYYQHSPPVDPQGPESGPFRAIRGGARANPWTEERSACRWPDFPPLPHGNVGFRIVCDAALQAGTEGR